MTQLINQSINDDGVYRTAPATPGLLRILHKTKIYNIAFLFAVPPSEKCTVGDRIH